MTRPGVRAQRVGDARRVGPGDLGAEQPAPSGGGRCSRTAGVRRRRGAAPGAARASRTARERGHAAGEGDRALGAFEPGEGGLEAGDGRVAEPAVDGRAVGLGAGRRRRRRCGRPRRGCRTRGRWWTGRSAAACSPSAARSSRPACTASVASALERRTRAAVVARACASVSMTARAEHRPGVRAPNPVLRSADGRFRRTRSGRSASAAAAAERRPDHVPRPRRAGRCRAVDLPGPGDPAAPLGRDPRPSAAARPGEARPRPGGAAVGAGPAAPAGADRPVRGPDQGAAGVADRLPPHRPRRLPRACGGRGHGGSAAAGARRVHLAARGGPGRDPADLPAVGVRPAAARRAGRRTGGTAGREATGRPW